MRDKKLATKQTPLISNGRKYFTLIFATWTLIVNFWAWSILSPLGANYASDLDLSPLKLSFLLAAPVIIGSLGRIIFGIATDKYGGRKMFIATCLLTLIPILGLTVAKDYSQLFFAAMLLGTGGAAFVIGIPFLSAWFPPAKRGLVLGIYSIGNAGTAVSAFLTPRLSSSIGLNEAFLLVGGLLVITAAIFVFFVEESPNWSPSKDHPIRQLRLAAINRTTWDLSLVYVITFGAFVAFGVYLPVLLKTNYALSLTDAATRAAGFILLATVARPIGGWLSDKFGGKKVIMVSLAMGILLSTFVAFEATLQVQTTVAYLALAFALGCSNGAVFALVGRLIKPEIMGSVTGIVGACGGLGGFFPPLVLGLSYQRTNSYSIALVALAISAFLVFLYIRLRFRTNDYEKAIA